MVKYWFQMTQFQSRPKTHFCPTLSTSLFYTVLLAIPTNNIHKTKDKRNLYANINTFHTKPPESRLAWNSGFLCTGNLSHMQWVKMDHCSDMKNIDILCCQKATGAYLLLRSGASKIWFKTVELWGVCEYFPGAYVYTHTCKI
jgi:hypothetical protein